MKLTPSGRLYLLGVVMLAALTTWARYRGRDGALLFLVPLAVAGVAYLLTIREFSRTPKFARHVVLVCLGLSVLWRIPFLLGKGFALDIPQEWAVEITRRERFKAMLLVSHHTGVCHERFLRASPQ